jgi:hypothetical protein
MVSVQHVVRLKLRQGDWSCDIEPAGYLCHLPLRREKNGTGEIHSGQHVISL